jgi:hypothetical protein
MRTTRLLAPDRPVDSWHDELARGSLETLRRLAFLDGHAGPLDERARVIDSRHGRARHWRPRPQGGTHALRTGSRARLQEGRGSATCAPSSNCDNGCDSDRREIVKSRGTRAHLTRRSGSAFTERRARRTKSAATISIAQCDRIEIRYLRRLRFVSWYVCSLFVHGFTTDRAMATVRVADRGSDSGSVRRMAAI